jgi:hypothetical protein
MALRIQLQGVQQLWDEFSNGYIWSLHPARRHKYNERLQNETLAAALRSCVEVHGLQNIGYGIRVNSVRLGRRNRLMEWGCESRKGNLPVLEELGVPGTRAVRERVRTRAASQNCIKQSWITQ